MKYPARLFVYAAVIACAPLLDAPWMVAVQAGLGGIMLGMRLERYLEQRRRSIWATGHS